MTDWYVDSAAAGDNSGTSAVNATINITSLYARVGSGPVAGDFVWVRRTHFEDIPVSGGTVSWGSNSGQLSSNSVAAWNWLVGWPNSQDVFFDMRPTAPQSGATPDWDNDASSPYPTIVTSSAITNRGVAPRGAFAIYNFTMVNSVNLQTPVLVGNDQNKAALEKANWQVYGRTASWETAAGVEIPNLSDVTITTSLNTFLFSSRPLNAGKITITASSVIRSLFSATYDVEIQHIHNDSNSLGAIFTWNGGTIPNYLRPLRIRRLSGIKPNNGFITGIIDFDNANVRLFVDDFYGEGPRIIGPSGGHQTYRTTSAQANYVGRETYCTEVMSGGSDLIFAQGRLHNHTPDATAWIRVSSGTPVSVAWPIYGVGAPNPDLYHGKLMFLTHAFSGQVTNPLICGSRYLKSGNVNSWSGTSLTAGSAYFMVHTITPRETGTIQAQLYIPGFNTRSGYWVYPAQPDIA